MGLLLVAAVDLGDVVAGFGELLDAVVAGVADVDVVGALVDGDAGWAC